jgi:hypothetical protein
MCEALGRSGLPEGLLNELETNYEMINRATRSINSFNLISMVGVISNYKYCHRNTK